MIVAAETMSIVEKATTAIAHELLFEKYLANEGISALIDPELYPQ